MILCVVIYAIVVQGCVLLSQIDKCWKENIGRHKYGVSNSNRSLLITNLS